MIELILPDGSHQEHPEGVTGNDVAAEIGAGLARAAVAARLDGQLLDLSRPCPAVGRSRCWWREAKRVGR